MNKKIAVIISFIFLLSSFQALTVSAGKNDEALRFLIDMGFLDGENIDAGQGITRRDFAETVVSIMGYSGGAEPVDTVFSDVKHDDEKSGYINLVSSVGIMKGYSDGRFLPYSMVTYSQAVKILVAMTGYDVYGELYGGYPSGYSRIAAEIGIINGLNIKANDEIPAGELALMIKNALEIDVLERVTYGNDITYQARKGVTLLSKGHSVYKIEGRLTATYFSSLAGGGTRSRNIIEVDGIQYLTDKSDIYKYLGYYLTFYIKQGDGNRDEIAAITSKSAYNAETYISGDDIISVKENKIIYADENGREKTALFDSDTDFIYNGKAKLSWSITELSEKNLDLRLLDFDNDGCFDVIFGNNYVNLIVQNVVTDSKAIYFKTNSPEHQRISFSEDKKYIITDKNDKEIQISDLKEWDVLSVAKSLDGEVYFIKYSDDSFSGLCTESASGTVTIDGVSYDVDDNMAGNSKIDSAEIGRAGVFYRDFRGMIAAANYKGNKTGKYGYVVGMTKGSGLGTEVKIRLYTEDGEFKNFDLAPKLKLDETVIPREDITDNTVINQLVIYEVNAKGEINGLETSKDGSLYDRDQRLKVFTKDDEFASVAYRGGNMRMMASRYIIPDYCKIFVIPDDISDELAFGMYSAGSLYADAAYPNVAVYDVDGDSRVSAMTMKTSAQLFVNYSSPVGVVTAVSKAQSDDGDNRVKLTVFAEGKTVTLVPNSSEMAAGFGQNVITDTGREAPAYVNSSNLPVDSIPVSAINAGDVVQYSTNASGALVGIKVLMRGKSRAYKENMGTGTTTKDNAYSATYCSFSKVQSNLLGGIRVSVPAPNSQTITYERVFPYYSGTIFVRFLDRTGSVTPITASDIEINDDVFIYALSSNVKLVMVYE